MTKTTAWPFENDATYLVRAVGDAGKDVYVVGDPDQNLGTWVDIRDVALAELGRESR